MMRRMAILLVVFGSFALSQSLAVDSTDANSGIVYGEDYAFGLTAPPGWVLDNSSGVPQGLDAVFYPKGGSWEKSSTVMYANTASKKSEGNETLEKLMDFDKSQFKHDHPDLTIVEADSIPTEDKKLAVIRLFQYSKLEAVAYIDEEKIISMLVLTAQTKKDFDIAFPRFKELIESYFFISTDVRFDH